MDVVIGEDRLLNAARAGEVVETHGALPRCEATEVGAVFGVQRLNDLAAHPGGERFVQPDVVPPRHRDEIAKPLMGELVRQHIGEQAALIFGRALFVDQQDPLAESNQTDVLHGACGKIGDSDQVELSVGVGDPEIVFEHGDEGPRAFEGVRQVRPPALGRDPPKRNREWTPFAWRNGRPGDDLERAHCPGEEIGW